MRISFVEPHLKLYGGIRRIIEFANRFTDLGETVSIYHPTGAPCAWMECRARVRRLDELDREPHDVVIFNDPPDYRVVRRASADLKVFYILELYDRDWLLRFDPKILWPRKGRMLVLKRALQMPFLMVANATWIQRWLHEHLDLAVELQLGGINRELFHPITPRRAVGSRGGTFRMLCSGDPREHKGTATIRDAVERVRREHALELTTYYGRGIAQAEMAAAYAAADLFVDAQWHAGWNNPVVEAMACGTPVVCTDIGGVHDFAFHERTALLVPPRDPTALAAAIARMMEDPGLRERLRGSALAEVARFDWARAAGEFLALLYDRSGRGRIHGEEGRA